MAPLLDGVVPSCQVHAVRRLELGDGVPTTALGKISKPAPRAEIRPARWLDDLDRPVRAGDTITIIQAVSGGSATA